MRMKKKEEKKRKKHKAEKLEKYSNEYNSKAKHENFTGIVDLEYF